jgi:putative transposase
MKTVRVYRLHPSPSLAARLKAAQMEAAAVWNTCCALHKNARQQHTPWPNQHEMQQATRGRFALHSQSVQAIFRAFLGTIDTTREVRKTHPAMRIKYPWRTKQFYPVHWPAQAVSKEERRVVLPMGKGRKSLVLPLDLLGEAGACTLVWNRGFELHVCMEVPQAEEPPGTRKSTVDLGEIVRREVA